MKELKDATIAFRVTEQEKAELIRLAEQQDIALSKLLRKLVKEFIEREAR